MIQYGKKYTLWNVHATHRCLDLSGEDRKSILGYEFHGGGNQLWLLVETSSGWVLKSVGVIGKFLGVEGKPGPGAPIVAVDHAFKWHIRKDQHNDQLYRLVVPGTSWHIALPEIDDSILCAPIQLEGATKGQHQCWHFKQAAK